MHIDRPVEQRPFRRVAIIFAPAKFLLAALLCLTPVTAVIVLGWLTRKTGRDIAQRTAGRRPGRWPNFLRAEDRQGRTWFGRWSGALTANSTAGFKAWISVLILTGPFSLIWLVGWFAGWENSFNKGYELSGVWPLTSLLAVVLSTPVLVLVPMAIAHQAAKGAIVAALHFREIGRLVRAAAWSYLGLTLMIAVGCLATLLVRAIPVFAEQISPHIASGVAGAYETFAAGFRFWATIVLITGLLVLRHAMARVYVTATHNVRSGRKAGRIKTAIVFFACGVIWLAQVFLIYVGQFLNYNWWAWLNQPVYMLPWIGVV
jgi:hypothetical protein